MQFSSCGQLCFFHSHLHNLLPSLLPYSLRTSSTPYRSFTFSIVRMAPHSKAGLAGFLLAVAAVPTLLPHAVAQSQYEVSTSGTAISPDGTLVSDPSATLMGASYIKHPAIVATSTRETLIATRGSTMLESAATDTAKKAAEHIVAPLIAPILRSTGSVLYEKRTTTTSCAISPSVPATTSTLPSTLSNGLSTVLMPTGSPPTACYPDYPQSGTPKPFQMEVLDRDETNDQMGHAKVAMSFVRNTIHPILPRSNY